VASCSECSFPFAFSCHVGTGFPDSPVPSVISSPRGLRVPLSSLFAHSRVHTLTRCTDRPCSQTRLLSRLASPSPRWAHPGRIRPLGQHPAMARPMAPLRMAPSPHRQIAEHTHLRVAPPSTSLAQHPHRPLPRPPHQAHRL